MNKLIVCLFALLCATVSIDAKNSKDVLNGRNELYKASKNELNEKASKAARKEAKKFIKKGWTTAPGALPLEMQLDKSYLMQMEYDEFMYPKYIMGEAISIGENYDAAKMQALELAKQNLASQIQTEIKSIVENSVANKQLPKEDASSIVESIMGAKNRISQSIGRTIIVVECYREKEDKKKEVLVRIACNGIAARNATKQALHDDLENKSKELQNTLNDIIGW